MKKIKILALILLVIACVGCKKENEKENESGGENKVENKINGHDYVDLGLPSGLKWGTCNIGAASPSDYGNYYAWGETSPKTQYTEENCITYEEEMSDISGNSQYDAARKNWGGTWRMPKQSEMQELIDKCTWVWTLQNGQEGCKVLGPNGNHIFLPATGFRKGTTHDDAGVDGYYWSSTPDSHNLPTAVNLFFYDGFRELGGLRTYYGLTIRPVAD